MRRTLNVLKVFSVVAMLSASMAAKADLIGYYESGATNSPAAAIAAAGHTAVALPGLSAAELAGIDVLWILNGNNGTPDAQVTGNVASVGSFVQAGGVLSFHDRNVNQGGVSAATYLPGAGGVNFVSDFTSNIDIVTANAVTAGLDDTSLDGGNFSAHGYADLASLPGGAVSVLSNGNPNEIIDFYYGLGSGFVYYSSIPLDFYLGGGGVAAFSTIYAPQEAGFQASLASPPVVGVPTPGSLALLGLGLFALVASTAKRGKKSLSV